MLNKSLKSLHPLVDIKCLAKGGRAYVGVPSRCDIQLCVNFSFNIVLLKRIHTN